MRRFLLIIMLLSAFAAGFAQAKGNGKRQFNPKKFEADLEAYVVKHAGLTKTEGAKFLPIYRDMRKKQITIMDANRKAREKKPRTEKEWAAGLKALDNMDIQLKKIQQTYHNKMLTVIPASKVMKVIKAEDDFHRESFRKVQGAGGGGPHLKPGGFRPGKPAGRQPRW